MNSQQRRKHLRQKRFATTTSDLQRRQKSTVNRILICWGEKHPVLHWHRGNLTANARRAYNASLKRYNEMRDRCETSVFTMSNKALKDKEDWLDKVEQRSNQSTESMLSKLIAPRPLDPSRIG